MDFFCIDSILSFFRDIWKFIIGLHIKHCQCVCCESDCIKTPPPSPTEEEVHPILN